jgi:hypothetical protein
MYVDEAAHKHAYSNSNSTENVCIFHGTDPPCRVNIHQLLKMNRHVIVVYSENETKLVNIFCGRIPER